MIEKKEETLKLDKETMDRDIEIWKVAINTQMHFNDLLIKMRTTVISIILAVFGAASIALRDMVLHVGIGKMKIHVSAIALMIGIIFIVVQYLVDRFYYFKLLTGAVNFTKKIDEKYKNINGVKFGLTESIIESVSEKNAKILLLLFYGIPLLLCGISIILILINT